MRITAIHGQNHKGSTWNAANLLIENIDCDKTVEEFFLPRNLNHFCLGCYSCLEGRERCPFWEEKSVIMDSILKSDLIIVTTPNYCMMPSAPLKTFLDLFFTNWLSHKPYEEMYSKKAVVISTAAGAGAKKAVKPVADNLRHWGIPKVYCRGYIVNSMSWESMPEKKKAKLEKSIISLAKKLSTQGKPRVGLKTRIQFKFYRSMQKAGFGSSESEKKYWEDKGWLSGEVPWKKNRLRADSIEPIVIEYPTPR